MKTIEYRQSILVFAGFALLFLFLLPSGLFAQCKPMIKIDGIATVVNQNDDFGLRFPYWLNEGQTLAVGSSVAAISVIEFDLNDSTLEIEQVMSVTSVTPVSVPTGKVWKLESALVKNNSSSYKSSTFSPGTFTFTVPGCAEEICIEAWGGGGGGSSAYYHSTQSLRRPGGGGGGGGFGSECFVVTPGDQFTIIVGAGGAGGAGTSSGGNHGGTGGDSSVGSLILVTGGGGGQFSSSSSTGGAGGSSAALSNANGAPGGNGASTYNGLVGAGGAGGNGGAGGTAPGLTENGNPGTFPGGGGSGGGGNSTYSGGRGGDGRVIISW